MELQKEKGKKSSTSYYEKEKKELSHLDLLNSPSFVPKRVLGDPEGTPE
jgi:hypothetical protein